MPAWPDILSKYNILLSQTHNFSTSLLSPVPLYSGATSAAGSARTNAYEKIALHPRVAMSDTQLDNDVIPLLRNQQTTDVLRIENDTVRRLAERMATRGSLGVLGASNPPGPTTLRKPEYEDVLKECDQIRDEHDRRVERAVRAVTMLRDKFDWKQRVEVEVEEPEELDWDPRIGTQAAMQVDNGVDGGADDGDRDEDVGMDSPDAEGDGGQSSDEDEVEGELVDAAGGGTEPTTPISGAMQGVILHEPNGILPTDSL